MLTIMMPRKKNGPSFLAPDTLQFLRTLLDRYGPTAMLAALGGCLCQWFRQLRSLLTAPLRAFSPEPHSLPCQPPV
jgi:hypothetical protein